VNRQSPLPVDEALFVNSLPNKQLKERLRALWLAGWSLSTLGDAVEPSRSKSTIHFWVRNADDSIQRREIPNPAPTSLTSVAPTKSAPRLRTISPGVPSDMKAHLRELSTLAKRYRAKTPYNSPLAQANRELTELARSLRSRGVPTAAIADAAGVTYRAMAKRLSQ
jgi:hypothetical protein